MNWTEELEIVIAWTKHEAFRAKCADDHPEKEFWRAQIVRMATETPQAPRQAEPWQIPLDQQVMKPQRCCGG